MNNYLTRINLRSTILTLGVVLFILALSGCGNVTITEIDGGPAPLVPLKPTATIDDQLISYVMPTPTSPALGNSLRVSGAIAGSSLEEEVEAPPPEAEPSAEPTTVSDTTSVPQRYQVKEGDTLKVIAINYAISVDVLKKANNLTTDEIRPGQMLNIPTAEQIVAYEIESGAAIPTPQTEQGDLIHYIQPGETISSIAELYKVDRRDLLFANGFRPDVQLVAGTAITIPQDGYDAIPTATAVLPLMGTATPAAIAQAEPTATSTPVPATPESTTYTVQSGDYAKTIAEAHGITLEALRTANPEATLDSLAVGQELTLPSSSGAAPQPTAPPTVTATAVPPTATPMATAASSEFQLTQAVVPAATPSGQAPMLTMPENGSVWAYQQGRKPFQFVWAPMDWLAPSHYYVLQVWAESDSGQVYWSESVWTQLATWRMPTQWLDRVEGEAHIKWNVRIMKLLSGDPALTQPTDQATTPADSATATQTASNRPRGELVSRKSDTFVVTVLAPGQ